MKTTLKSLLAVSLLAFTLDLLHLIYHLTQDPALWQVPGVPVKFLVKVICFLIPVFLWAGRKIWLSWLVLFILFSSMLDPPRALAGSGTCQRVRELIEQSGVARDASENMLGHVKRHPPYGSFPPDMDKITWWGVFKPFEFWENPELQAVWINPDGEEAGRQKFRGTKCRLAKSSLRGEDQPRGEFRNGMWKVIVTCQDYLIDQQNFAVLPPSASIPGQPAPAEGFQNPKSSSQQTAMIWAKDALEEHK